MATRSIIAIHFKDQKENNGWPYLYVYCHWDGYPEHHLPILQHSYNTHEKALELIKGGDISILDHSCAKPEGKHDFDIMGRQEGFTLYYGRDRGETGKGIGPKIGVTQKRMNQEEWLYIFSEAKGWTVKKGL